VAKDTFNGYLSIPLYRVSKIEFEKFLMESLNSVEGIAPQTWLEGFDIHQFAIILASSPSST
jgi:hypothetical protein